MQFASNEVYQNLNRNPFHDNILPNNWGENSLSSFDNLSVIESFTKENIANRNISYISGTHLGNAPVEPIFTSKISSKYLQLLKIQFKLWFSIQYPASFFNKIANGEYYSIIAIDKITKELLGFSIIDINFKDKDTKLLAIGVVKEYQNKKIGSAIWNKTIEELVLLGIDEVSLIVQEINWIAIMLYKKFGFDYSKRITNYYHVLTNEEEKAGIEMTWSVKKSVRNHSISWKNAFSLGCVSRK